MSGLINLLKVSAMAFILQGCGSDNEAADPTPNMGGPSENEIIKIPVVVHVIYRDDTTNITQEKIASQIQVLNEDFRKLNNDYTSTPDEFLPLVADVGIEFELATIDPDGNETSGITRTFSDVIDGWSGRDLQEDTPLEQLALFFSDLGGQDAWPRDHYLNIWVADMSTRHEELGLNGYSSSIGDDPRIDGVVIDPRVFGTLAPLDQKYSLGRTATHEIGHWLNLIHIYAGNNSCDSSDLVDDTPTAYGQYGGTPVYPQVSCGSTDITMNFMDNVNDSAMTMFTNGQKARMRAVFEKDGGRHQLFLNNLNFSGNP